MPRQSTMTDPTDRTTRTYDIHARTYAQINRSTAPVQPMLDRFERHCAAGAVLDVGCGHGRDAHYFTAHGCRVIGVDMSVGLLFIARQTAPGASFCQADMRRLPFPAASFKGLWVCASLLHIPRTDAPMALREFRRVLKPGGVLYVGVKAGTGEAWVSTQAYGGAERFFVYYRPEELAALVREAGFSIMEQSEQDGWINVFARKTGPPM